jgi:hypothetical protein
LSGSSWILLEGTGKYVGSEDSLSFSAETW